MSAVGFGRVAITAEPSFAIHVNLRKTLLIAGTALLMLGAAAYGFRWWTVGRWLVSTDDAYVGGNVTAIAPHVAGFVSEIAVRDNQFVRRGQVIVRLDDRDFETADDH